MIAWQWVLKQVPKTAGCRFRVWLATMPLQPLPGGRPVEFRLHLKQWDGKAQEPYSWCIQETKYAATEPDGPMDPYKPFSIKQISERDWPAYLSTLAAEIRTVLEVELPKWKAAAPAIQGSFSSCAHPCLAEPRAFSAQGSGISGGGN